MIDRSDPPQWILLSAMSATPKIPILLMARELDIGGSERQMTEVAKRLDLSVFAPHVGCMRPAGMRGDELRDSGVTIVQFPVYSYRSPAAFREAAHLVRYIRDHGIRIVHTWDYPLSVYAIPIARTMTQAIAVSSQRCHRDLIPSAYRPLVVISDRMAHAVVVNCEYLRRHLIEQRVPEQKIRVCPNGIDLDQFRRLPQPERPLTIGVVCALRPEKDLPTLIDAFALVRHLAPGSETSDRGKRRSTAGIATPRTGGRDVEPQCHFEPATPAVAEWLSRIDIFVLPSRSEALSNSLMEAMACGCCVDRVGRRWKSGTGTRPGNRNPVSRWRRGEPGGSVPHGDRGPALRARLAESGERFVRPRFAANAAAARMGEVYPQYAGAAKRRAP